MAVPDFLDDVALLLADFRSVTWAVRASRRGSVLAEEAFVRRGHAHTHTQGEGDLRPAVSTFNALIFAYCAEGAFACLVVLTVDTAPKHVCVHLEAWVACVNEG